MNQNDSNDSSIKSEILSRKFINVDENDMQPDELFLNQITVENIEIGLNDPCSQQERNEF